MDVTLEIVDDPARACAAMMVGALAGGGHVVLAGGSTPKRANEELVAAVADMELDVSAATCWIGDERAVPPDDERSNYRMIRESLLDPLGENQPSLRRMKGELGYADGAADYERELREAGPPEFDLLLLGMGPDGHTLSLFPDQASLSERSRLVVGVPEAGFEPYVSRISFTLPALALARRVVFLVAGDSKADAVAAAFGPDAKPDRHVPSSLVASFAEEVIVLVDRDAASRL